MEKDAVHGPWKEIFKGIWSGFEVEMYENPDKITLINILEKKEDKTIGITCLMNKYYVFEGQITKMAGHMKGYSLVFEKHYPTFVARYFSISSGPKYTKTENLNSAIEDMHRKIEEKSERVYELGRVHSVTTTELKFANEDYWQKLFSEPILLPGLVMRKIPEISAKVAPGAAVLLGKKITGENAEESIQSFLKTVIIGDKELRRNAIHVILENCVLSGKTAIVFDEEDSFTSMSVPNKEFDYKTYPNLQPIGMPIKTLKPGDVKINLNLLDPVMFREIIGIVEKEKKYVGKDTIELIDKIIEKGKGDFKTLEDLEEKLLTVSVEAKKFHVYRAIRWIRILKNIYPEFFGGRMELRTLVPLYMKAMGSIVRIDLKGLPLNVKRAIIYSTIKSLYVEYKEQLSTSELKVIGCILSSAKYAGSKPATRLEEGILEVFSEGPNYGVGFCIGTGHEIDLFHEFTEGASMKMTFVGKKEIAVKEINTRPYRMKLRPKLSA